MIVDDDNVFMVIDIVDDSTKQRRSLRLHYVIPHLFLFATTNFKI